MELQNFINNNANYIQSFKDNNFKVKKHKNLIIVKNNYNDKLQYTCEEDYWKMYCRGAVIDTDRNTVFLIYWSMVLPYKTQW